MDWQFECEDGTLGDVEAAFDANLAPKKRGRKKKSELSFSSLDEEEEEEEAPPLVRNIDINKDKGELAIHDLPLPPKRSLFQYLNEMTDVQNLTAAASPVSTIKVNHPPVGITPELNAAAPPPAVPKAPEKKAFTPGQHVHIKHPAVPPDEPPNNDDTDAIEEAQQVAFYYGLAGGVILALGAYFAYRMLFASTPQAPAPAPAPRAPPPRYYAPRPQ